MLLGCCCTIGECGYSTHNAKFMAHSEVAIGLYLKNTGGKYKLIQIKNAWDMCEYCQNFWSGTVKINSQKIIGGDGIAFQPKKSFGNFALRVYIKGCDYVYRYIND